MGFLNAGFYFQDQHVASKEVQTLLQSPTQKCQLSSYAKPSWASKTVKCTATEYNCVLSYFQTAEVTSAVCGYKRGWLSKSN